MGIGMWARDLGKGYSIWAKGIRALAPPGSERRTGARIEAGRQRMKDGQCGEEWCPHGWPCEEARDLPLEA